MAQVWENRSFWPLWELSGNRASWLLVEGAQRIPIRNEALEFLGKPTLSIPWGRSRSWAVRIGCGRSAAGPARGPLESGGALRHE